MIGEAAMIAMARGKVKRGKGYLKCLCPAHDDHRPSLKISVNGERLRFHCFAGCETWRIRRALKQRGIDLARVA